MGSHLHDHVLDHVTCWSSILLHVPPLFCGGILVAQCPSHVFVISSALAGLLLLSAALRIMVAGLLV